MTVGELIKELNKYDSNEEINVSSVKQVYLGDSYWGIKIELSAEEFKRYKHMPFMGGL